MIPLLPALILLALQGQMALPKDARAIDPYLNLRDAITAVQTAQVQRSEGVNEAERSLAHLIAACLVLSSVPAPKSELVCVAEPVRETRNELILTDGFHSCSRSRDGPWVR